MSTKSPLARTRIARTLLSLLAAAATAAAVIGAGASAAPADPPPNCAAPGVEVSGDATGDQLGAPTANQQQDLVSVSLAEEYDPQAGGKLVATIKLAALDPNTLPRNGNWYAFFTARHADNSETAYFVSAATNELGQIAYSYGHVNGTTNVGNGAADSGVVSAGSRAIIIKVAFDKIRKPEPGTPFPTLTGALVDLSAGKTLTNVLGETSILIGSNSTPVVSGGLLQNVDESAAGTYTLAGAAACTTATPTPTPTPTPGGGGGGSDPAACLSPTVEVKTDAAGDQTGNQAGLNQSHDIRSVSLGEDYRFTNSDRVVFTLKVAALSPVPANGVWRTSFTAGGTSYYVAMNSDDAGAVSYDYGDQGGTGGTLRSLGTPEEASFAPDGRITIRIAKAKIGNPPVGGSISNIRAIAQQAVEVPGVGTAFPTLDQTDAPNPSYTLVGMSANCQQTQPPTGVTYLKGGIAFSPSYPTHAPATVRDGEPSVRVDKFGNAYVAGIRGVPAGNDLWYFDLRPTVGGQPNPTYDPLMRNPQYRGQPDAFTGESQPSLLADGGGDVDLAVSFPESDTEDPDNPPTLAFTSLLLANISTAVSRDRGVTFQKNPAGNVTGGVPIDDRQWFEAVGSNTVYLLYRTVAPAVTQIQRSTDGGLTWGPARTAGAIGQVGTVDVHKATGTVYISGSTGQVCVGVPLSPLEEPLTYTCKQAGPPAGAANLFFVVKVADDGTPNGTAYVTYSDGRSIFYSYSTDKGSSWSPAVRVSDGPETRTALMPWVETGPVPGTLGFVWYGTDHAVNNNDANWKVFYAHVTGADGPSPVIRQATASDHVIHASNISLSGLSPTATNVNRNLIDYFQVAFDPAGAAVIAYTDDHNDYDGNTYVTHQISGPSIQGGDVPAPAEGSALPPPGPYSADGAQVVDPPRDARSQTVILRTEEPVDITSITYSTEGAASDPVLVARMKVTGDLSTLPPLATWRVNFAANAPDSVLSPTGQFTFGVADRGDQFYMAAQTDASGAKSYRFGTLARNGNGGLDYTDRGPADFGSFDAASKTVTLKVALSKLNPFVRPGKAPLGLGTVLTGLRGQANIAANPSGRDPRSDATRGGVLYTIQLPRFNVALGANGAAAFASSVYPSWDFNPASAIDGDRTGKNWGSGGGWNDGTRAIYPDWLEVNFGGSRAIDEVRVYTLQDGYSSGVEPTETTTANENGIIDFDVQTWDGTSWVTVPGGAIRGNSLALRSVQFPAVTTA
ncbi:MAG TPA: discoidin domain-containing protein, partial [Pyrinomonadaceae bacterium]|nr:discoidin domain-containing protein [Pyrinomonadaceae bacterium]